ncbi:M56 family metallopeptidase [Clostridium tagluense]|uniref:M56 family metallopeptidase n=1 Tax=Clostridium tagluense TaxID=360422 RepID=UPI001C0DFA50|nr:M56 family metallopeptidase [Clostridium tagluense]MBU3128751.1 stage II sporulation protein P [Clostridium tagluense]
MDLLNIFEVIVLSSLIGSIIVLMILIVKGIFRNKLNSTFNYYIWLILIIKLTIPFGPQTTFNIVNLYENFHKQAITSENKEKSQINSSIQLENIDLGGSILKNSFDSSNKSVFSKVMNTPLKNKINIEKVFCSIWIFGIALLIGILVEGHKKLREIVGKSIKNIDSTHKEILYKCRKAMNIRTDVELSYSHKISSPSLCGLIKPKILIPMRVAANICDEEFKYIIMHELTHLKSKDIFINWVITLLSVIYWFNPILLYGFYKMRQDCEFSCDSQVISQLGEGVNLQYGNAIIRVLELGGRGNRIMGTTSMVMNSSEIKRRVIMISKYKKINIKGILLGTVVVIIIGGLGIALNTSNLNSDKNIASATTVKVETPVTTSKSVVNNISNEAKSTTIKKSPSDSTNPIVAFSSNIVIYNSHPDEDYPSGIKVTDVGVLINDKFLKEGLKSSFIKCNAPIEYKESFKTTRDLIIKNVKEYSNTILLDIHRDITESTNSDTRKILFVLAKSSPHYESNKKFVDRSLENIKNSKVVKSEILLYNFGISYFNQDLSGNAALIEIGNNRSSDSDIETCVNALVSAIKNIQKGSSK